MSKTITSYNPSEQTLVEHLESKGVKLKPAEVKDFGLLGNESDREIIQYANDFLSDLHTEECEAALFKRSPQAVNPIDY